MIKQIIALQQYTDKYVSLYEGQIRNIETELANRLIEQGIVAEHDETGPGGESGYSRTVELTTLFEDNVHFGSVNDADFTMARIEQLVISADKINVTFDGIEYEVIKTITDEEGVSVYGNFNFDSGMPSFIEYPFCIISVSSSPERTTIASNSTEENHNIKIEEKTETIETTEDFRKAVESVTNNNNNNLKIIQKTTHYDPENGIISLNIPAKELYTYFINGNGILFQLEIGSNITYFYIIGANLINNYKFIFKSSIDIENNNTLSNFTANSESEFPKLYLEPSY